MGRRRYSPADPTANTAIGNVTRQNKGRAPREKTRRKIVDEFPDIFRDLNEAQKVTITLAAARLSGARDAWAIDVEHLEQAKTDYFRSVR